MNIGNNIKKRRIELGLSVDELAKRIGKNRATIYRYESGEIKDFPITVLEPLAKALITTPADLMGYENSESTPEEKTGRIPLLATVAAGTPMFSSENIETYIDYDKRTDGVFAAHVHGNSMNPKILDGDVVVVDKEAIWSDNDIVIATVNGNEGTVKKIRRLEDGILLLPLNPDFDPISYTSKEVQEMPVVVIGKVVQLRRDL